MVENTQSMADTVTNNNYRDDSAVCDTTNVLISGTCLQTKFSHIAIQTMFGSHSIATQTSADIA